jgi:competence protein ComEA
MSEVPPAPPTWRDRLELLARPGGPAPVQVAGLVGGVVVVALVAWFLLREPPPPAESVMTQARPAAAAGPATTVAKAVVVHAAGAVLHPGVYSLRPGSRVQDLVAAAGGAAPGAQLDRLNLAALLVDGTQVYVPREGEAAPAVGGPAAATPSGPLNLNTATEEQLDELPGVGPATAQAIIQAREKRGGFRSVDDLLDVRGIGPAKLDALRDLVTV